MTIYSAISLALACGLGWCAGAGKKKWAFGLFVAWLVWNIIRNR
jgi:hypothetical protein